MEDLHRPYVDEVTWPCAKRCGGTMRRTPEVADVWFDSGAVPFAQHHYPFENREKVEREIAYLAIGLEKTAGPREREAWGWLMDAVVAHDARQTRRSTGP